MFNNIVNFKYDYQNLSGTKIEERFKINFNPVTRPLMFWKEEVKNTALRIAALSDKPLLLCLSGGIDAEVIARTFLENNIPFSALTIHHSSNDHDVIWADNFCKEHNIEQKIVEVDMLDFISKKIPEYREQGYRSRSIFRYFQLFLLETAESMNKCAILGGGDLCFKTIDNRVSFVMGPEFTICLDWCKNNNRLHFPYFYMQNSEITATYIKEDIIECMLANPDYFKNVKFNESLEKIIVYSKYFNKMPRRNKFFGFENIQELYDQFWEDSKKLYPDLLNMIIPVTQIQEELGI